MQNTLSKLISIKVHYSFLDLYYEVSNCTLHMPKLLATVRFYFQ